MPAQIYFSERELKWFTEAYKTWEVCRLRLVDLRANIIYKPSALLLNVLMGIVGRIPSIFHSLYKPVNPPANFLVTALKTAKKMWDGKMSRGNTASFKRFLGAKAVLTVWPDLFCSFFNSF